MEFERELFVRIDSCWCGEAFDPDVLSRTGCHRYGKDFDILLTKSRKQRGHFALIFIAVGKQDKAFEIIGFKPLQRPFQCR